MPTPRIRPATAMDCDAIAALLMELSRDEGAPRAVQGRDLVAALFTPRAVELQALVAEQDTQVLAVVLYYCGYDVLSASEGFHLADMVVTAAHRRRGIARALLANIAAQCLREGGQWLSLTALRSNAAAQGFYKAIGMTQVEVDFFAMGPSALMKLSG